MYYPRYLDLWYRFVLGGLLTAEVCIQPPSSHIEKVLALVMRFWLSHTIQSALEKGQEAGIVDFGAAMVNHHGKHGKPSAREFSSSSALWALKVLCFFWHNFSLIECSILCWMVAGTNWLTWCVGTVSMQGLVTRLFSAHSRAFPDYLRTSFKVILTTPLWLMLCQPLVENSNCRIPQSSS